MSAEPPPPQIATALGLFAERLPTSTGRCRLRPVGEADAEAVLAYRSLPEVTRFLGHPPLDLDGARELVDGWLADPTGLTVVVEQDGEVAGDVAGEVADNAVGDVVGEVVGDVRLRLRPASAMPPAGTEAVEAVVGYALHPAHQGRGLATEAVAAVVGLAFAAGVRRITARVFAPARPSSALLARLGFHLDGVDRAAVLDPTGRTWWDDECWSLLPEEWPAW